MDSKKYLDQEGVKYLWSKILMADYSNNETLIAVINAIDENKTDKTTTEALQNAINILNGTGDGSVKNTVAEAIATIIAQAPEDFDTLKEIADWIANDETGTLNLIERVEKAEAEIENLKPLDVQPDWNQSDETATDYIKNKPFGSVYTEENILEETTVTQFMESIGGLITTPPKGNLSKDLTYQVTYNGTLYNCLAYEGIFQGLTVVTLGNGTLVGKPSEEPFGIICVPSEMVSGFGAYMVVTPFDGATQITISISGLNETIHKIDNKYIQHNNSYIVNGSQTGSLRAVTAQAEQENDYTAGYASFAEGTLTKASGASAHAEGTYTSASGARAHAEGYDTSASGLESHAEGHNTQASGDHSHAEGYITTASSSASHAEGSETNANGPGAHAEGYGTVANGDYSHAEGFYTVANSNQHVQGKFNIIDDSSAYAHIVGNGSTDSERSNAHTLDWSGLGWFAGGLKIGGTGQNDANAKTVATQEYVNEQVQNKANADSVLLKTQQTLTEEELTQVHNNLKIAGRNVGGKEYTINGATVIAAGGAEVFNDYSNNVASGSASHAEGSGTTASGHYSHAEGGNNTTASGRYSHAEGTHSVASGEASHAEGGSTATHYCSHAEGFLTTASANYQHVQGFNNIVDQNSQYLHIVGNGTYTKPSNAHTIDWDGLGWFAGGLKVGGTSQNDTSSKEVAIKEEIPTKISQLENDSKFASEEYVQQYIPTSNALTLTGIDAEGVSHTWTIYGVVQ